jgi:hypothetical protein
MRRFRPLHLELRRSVALLLLAVLATVASADAADGFEWGSTKFW